MKYIFVYPHGDPFSKIKTKYQHYGKALGQRLEIYSQAVDGNAFLTGAVECNETCLDANILVVHVLVAVQAAQVMQHWRARDKVILIDLSTPAFLQKGKGIYQLGGQITTGNPVKKIPPIYVEAERMIWSLKLADGVVTNSQKIYEDWVNIIPIIYLPDFIDLDPYLLHPYEPHPNVRIGVNLCEGGVVKLRQTGLQAALETIGEEYSSLQVVVYGEDPPMGCELRLPSDRIRLIPGVDYQQWQATLASLDIGILPRLGEMDIRTGREDVLELMVMQIPWIASDGIWCHELRRYGWMVQNHEGAWERIMKDMISDLEGYRNESKEAYLYALGQGMDENMERWVALCSSFNTSE